MDGVNRDGTSQPERRPAALDPDHARVDERSTADLLAFARAYGEELVYYNDADLEDGDWSAFLAPDVDLDALGRAVDDPDSPLDGRARSALRPHVALFLAYVKLLGHARDQLNTITRRHLDFYYRDVLGLGPRGPVADRVHVIARLARGVTRALLPAGTLLDGGKDSLGKVRAYRIDRDVVVSRADIARISSVHVERDVVTLQRAREQSGSDHDAALLSMLSLALGDPAPGDPVPAYKGTTQVTVALLHSLATLTALAKSRLFMELYELDALAALLAGRAGEAGEWTQINGYLQIAARARLGDPAYVFAPANPSAFEQNLAAAEGGAPNLAALSGIATIDDLYYQRARQDVRAFIAAALHFVNVDDFSRMMQVKLRRDAAWREVNRILERCGRRKRGDETYRLTPADPAAFDQNLEAAVGPVDWSGTGVAGVGAYRAELTALERAFFMPAEDFAFMMAVHAAGGPTAADWDRVAEVLEGAHERKVHDVRRQRIKALGQGAGNAAAGLRIALVDALGEDHPGEDALALIERLRALIPAAADVAMLRSIAVAALATGAISGASWDRVAAILEPAKWIREGLKRPVPRKITWLDARAREDATSASTLGAPGRPAPSAAARPGAASGGDPPRWKPFGAASPSTDPASPPAPLLGFSMSSPLLALGEGKRTIAVTLALDPATYDAARVASALAAAPFAVALSTAEGYVEAGSVTITQGDYRTLSGVGRVLPAPLPGLRISVDLGEDAAPVAPPPIPGGAPVLRIMLRPIWDAARGRFVTPYEAFKGLVLAAAHLRVEARGLRALSIENDRSALHAKKPFEPFGASPAVGSRFYLGHPEICEKALDSLTLRFEWMQPPADLAVHYAIYGITPAFTARVALHDRGREVTLVPAAPLFAATGPRDPHAIAVADVRAALQSQSPSIAYGSDPGAARAGGAVSTWRRHVLWELSPLDFQHQAYPRLAARKAGELTAAIAKSSPPGSPAVDVAAYQVPPPYTPVVKRLSADYAASVEARLDAGAGAGSERIRHVHPFGECDVAPEAGRGAALFPPYDDHEGELYIGLRDMDAPGTLTLLFRVAEGSADPDLPPAEVAWSRLDGDRWVSLHDGGVRSDGTLGLQRTGILELSIDRGAPGTRMPGGLTWLRAAVREGAGSVCDIVGVHAQAAAATLVDQGDAPEARDRALPAGTLQRLLQPVRGIAGAAQPYPSFGGRPAERGDAFETRASERLRHKQRALSAWDYERLVLERFPEIYRALCLPASASDPGAVTLVVIPDVKDRISADPFEPKAPAAALAEIASYLSDKIPPGARIEVRNARFIAVQVRLEVRFADGCDEGFYSARLSDEICRFLSPWAFEEGADITMENRIYANQIIDFVDRRPYIDYVAGITLLRGEGGAFTAIPRPEAGGYHVAAGAPDAVLVAAPAHEIDTSWQYRVAPPAGADAGAGAGAGTGGPAGIGKARVGSDFILGRPAVLGAGIEQMSIEVDFQVA